MSEAAVPIALAGAAGQRLLTVRTVVTGLLGLFAFDNLLLLHFWGLPVPVAVGLAVVAGAAIWTLSAQISDDLPPVSGRTFAVAMLVSLALFALGGEGRFFYANPDWQIRDAVLHDMASNPWPLGYDVGGSVYFLRAPIGMYLLPAMFDAGAEIAMLVSDSLRLALLLTLAWYLFETKRERAIALAVFLLFSGWDVVGAALYQALGARLPWDHIEHWNFGYQYSSHVTQAFWVPQHGIAGWTCAIAFLLWRRGIAPLGVFAATVPLVAIWSPLAMIGAIPFALFAGLDTLRRRAIDVHDIGLAALALAIALPALFYLQVDASSVGLRLLPTRPFVWALCIALEVLPFAWPLLRDRLSPSSDRAVILLILSLLLVMPLVQVGVTADFQMRASIMPLALLAIYFAQWLCALLAEKPKRAAAIAYAAVAVLLGAGTPLLELRRALIHPPSPRPLCSLIGVWYKQDGLIVPYSTYLAPLTKLPRPLRNVPVVLGRSDPGECWDRQWDLPLGMNRRAKA
jgi:hypothetical protein